MVLQRETHVPVWGWASPGSKITVTFAKQKKQALADAKGRWELQLDPLPAGGPLTLKVEGEDKIEISDVLVGDVYLCSGQSNMEWTVQSSKDFAKEQNAAQFPQIRHYKVPLVTAPKPLETVGGEWTICSPKTVGHFTAAGYFFARHLHQELGVPIGLINSSWGGTLVEAWTSEEALQSDPRVKGVLSQAQLSLKNAPAAWKAHTKAVIEWEKAVQAVDPGNKGYEKGWADLDHPRKGWKTMDLPRFWEQTGLNIDGAVWFRKEVTIPKEWSGKDLTLRLGAVDDFDTTYFNGKQVGATGKETPNWHAAHRIYTIPADIVQTGKNVIAVRVFDHYGNGGLPGPATEMRLELAKDESGKSISLVGNWYYQVEYAITPQKNAPNPPAPPMSPNSQNLPCNLYRGMISALIPYALRGALWYQGESNADRAEQYKILFPMLIQDWRRRWGRDFAFFFVQLAGFENPGFWPPIREAQLSALDLPFTGTALAIDIGEPTDIHPKNKQDIGLRLALQALKVVYGKKVIAFGPTALKAVREGAKVRVPFEGTEGGLQTTDKKPIVGFTLKQGKKEVAAKAKIVGRDLVLSAPGVTKPTEVSYAWSNFPKANLTNASGLPALPFNQKI